MSNYDHITKYENIMDNHEEKLKELSSILDYLEENMDDYRSLMEYYHSDQRYQDLEDDSNGIIPQDLKRGVLSEDAIYNLIADYYDLSLRMLEHALNYMRL